jgi:two-component system alkaline phosphatase synthesis response regulator PhoP
LKDAGFNVVLNQTGDNVTEILNIELCIIDLRLPQKSGGDVVKELRATKQYEQVPIIILSASSALELTRVKETLPVQKVLAKPFDIKELVETVNKLLDGVY